MKLIIDRNKWYRGKGSDSSRLLLTDTQRTSPEDIGKQCCVGVFLSACGVGNDILDDVGLVDGDIVGLVDGDIVDDDGDGLPAEARWLVDVQADLGEYRVESSSDANKLYAINDTYAASGLEKEHLVPVPDSGMWDCKSHYFITEEDREQRIRDIFFAHGVEVEFIN